MGKELVSVALRGLAGCVVRDVGGGLAASSVGSDPGAGRLLGSVCAVDSVASMWWLCCCQPHVPTGGGLGLQKPGVLGLSPGLRCCAREKSLGFYVF